MLLLNVFNFCQRFANSQIHIRQRYVADFWYLGLLIAAEIGVSDWYQTNAQGLKIRPTLQRNAATLLELKRFLNLANPKNVMSTQIQKPLNPPSLQIDDVAEDGAKQRFANYMRLQKRNARGA